MRLLICGTRTLVVFTLLTGILYPLMVTVIGAYAMSEKAKGSLLLREGRVIGSSLIAQASPVRGYFQARPSASAFGAVPSGASNFGPTSENLKKVVAERRASLGKEAPAELLFASASGLDPHLSPEAAQFQIQRILKERNLGAEHLAGLRRLLDQNTESPSFGWLGPARVNVLKLNLDLDGHYGAP